MQQSRLLLFAPFWSLQQIQRNRKGHQRFDPKDWNGILKDAWANGPVTHYRQTLSWCLTRFHLSYKSSPEPSTRPCGDSLCLFARASRSNSLLDCFVYLVTLFFCYQNISYNFELQLDICHSLAHASFNLSGVLCILNTKPLNKNKSE